MASKSFQYNQNTYNISYEIINPSAKYDLIVLHGWGSNKEIMKNAFSPFLDSFRHIYIDLPGFGGSVNHAVLDTKNYAEIIEMFLELIGSKHEIIMGHSFGGKIATLLNPKLLVLLSSAGIKVEKPLDVQMKIKMTKIGNAFGLKKIGKLFRAKDADNLTPVMYETFKNVVDEDFSEIFSSFTSKALICWGEDDKATPLHAGEQMHKLIKGSHFTVYQGDHFFFANRAKAIAQEIEQEYLK